ncbi:G-type lectin S-receptor-like serine/threonine-protein kinase0 [Salvia divinorum]|uniref:G-type lectin S-receptor-like serine/threonine-protein kinase0 n=1 Tax=Salvia divinorum TaxID=28513 RepID=A0ABD1I7N0_SALDI
MKEVWKSFLPILFIHTIFYTATDSINISESINDEETGIWAYCKIPYQTVVWVANRGAPLTNKTGVLTLTAGTLSLLNETNDLIWSTNTSRTVQNPTARLLDSGNLVVKDADDDRPENFLWQSFDHPTDTYLPNMKMG